MFIISNCLKHMPFQIITKPRGLKIHSTFHKQLILVFELEDSKKYLQERHSKKCHRAMARVDLLPRPESQYIYWAPRKKDPSNPRSGTDCFYLRLAPMSINIPVPAMICTPVSWLNSFKKDVLRFNPKVEFSTIHPPPAALNAFKLSRTPISQFLSPMLKLSL